MKEENINYIAYQLKQLYKSQQKGAIVFLGAGASITGGIPRASKIEADILERYSDNPKVQRLTDRNYYKMMACLTAVERKDLLNDYIENAKINVAHIYLANLMKQGYIDYIVTVNFDNLSLRALALYNIFPATYDFASLKEITTSAPHTQSISFLHGQHRSYWMLNTEEEMHQNPYVPDFLRSICHNRPWIVVGYSAADPIFNQLTSLGSFDSNMYWVGNKDKEPAPHIKEKLLEKDNMNAYWIKGYDADSFFAKLNAELELEQPFIFSKPFSFLNDLHSNIVDIQDSEDYKAMKERKTITGNWINECINKYEKGNKSSSSQDFISIEEDKLMLDLLDCRMNSDYELLDDLEKKVKRSNDPSKYDDIRSWIYYDMSLDFRTKNEFDKAINSCQKAIEVKPDRHEAWNSMGNVYLKKKDYDKAIECYQKALKIKPDMHEAFHNIGISYASQKDYDKALEYYQKALEINPDKEGALINMGISYYKKKDYDKAIECYQEALKIKPDLDEAFYNIGFCYADKKNNSKAIENILEALKIKPDQPSYNNSLGFYYIKSNSLDKAKPILERAIELGSPSHAEMNLGHVFLCKGDTIQAIKHYQISLKNFADREKFLSSMRDDYQYLEQYGITKEAYEEILNQI